MSTPNELLAIRIVVSNSVEFDVTRDFYRRLLGRDEDGSFGDSQSVQQAAFFRLGNVELIVTRELDATPEARIRQGPVWLCFRTENPDSAFADARARDAALPHEPVNTSFGTRGFFANDPMGLPVYVGTAWQSPRGSK